jgi:hypothetical protein
MAEVKEPCTASGMLRRSKQYADQHSGVNARNRCSMAADMQPKHLEFYSDILVLSTSTAAPSGVPGLIIVEWGYCMAVLVLPPQNGWF